MREKVPDFFIAGAVKSGSTSAYYYLSEHPEVFMSPIKEPHYFSSDDMDFSLFRPLVRKRVQSFNLDAYLDSNMDQVVHRAYIRTITDYVRLFKNMKDEKAVGEASTSYLWSVTAPKRIKQQIPDAKIIIMLRNPVERAFSHYLMDFKNNLVKGSFSDALEQDQKVIHASWGKNSMYVETGMYAEQVKRFMDIFPAEQILIVLYDDFKGNTLETMKTIYHFLAIDESYIPDLTKKYNTFFLPVNPLAGKIMNNIFLRKHIIDRLGNGFKEPFKKLFSKKGEQPAMSDKEKLFLMDVYKEDIVNLQQLIKKDLSNWLK